MSDAKEMLQKNLDYVESRKAELLPLYRNKFLLVHNQTIVGSFDAYETAAIEGIESFGPESGFLVYELLGDPINNFAALAML